MILVIKTVEEVDAFAEVRSVGSGKVQCFAIGYIGSMLKSDPLVIGGIMLAQLIQHLHFDLTRIPTIHAHQH